MTKSVRSRLLISLLFVLGNLAIGAPARAGLDDDVCVDSRGMLVGCCTNCYFLCDCSLI